MENYVNGSIAGMFGVLLSHPFDTIKTCIQENKPIKYNPKFLYRGLSSPLLGIGIEKSIVFGTYNLVYNHTNNNIISGGIAGLCASLIVTPFEKYKINKQLGNKFIFNNIYKGLSVTFTREIPGFSIYFSSYNYLKDNQSISHFQSFLYGGMSGIIAWTFIYPQDRIKTYIQSHTHKITIKEALSEIKIRNLYKGFSYALMRAIPLHSGIFMMMEILNKN